MNDETFDPIAFVAWFEAIIDFIRSILEKISAKMTTTTAANAEETPVE